MKTRLAIVLLMSAVACAAPVPLAPPGFSLYITSAAELAFQADRAEGSKWFWSVAGDDGFAAYYAGRESVFREQLNSVLQLQP